MVGRAGDLGSRCFAELEREATREQTTIQVFLPWKVAFNSILDQHDHYAGDRNVDLATLARSSCLKHASEIASDFPLLYKQRTHCLDLYTLFAVPCELLVAAVSYFYLDCM